MRPLKLRVWDRAQQKFHYGGACHRVGRHRWFFGMPIPHPDDCELTQFTGVIDKNGTEIYEGDVVAYFQDDKRGFSRIIFADGMFRLEHSAADLQSWVDANELEVIGNIHANPELVKESPQPEDFGHDEATS